ncbi:hypothetical protein TPAR_06823 [Tolypocladium paradoxum]|uniref:Uncharacterized protein n=1 Tax=Tolypocladium paradoxum TaxID=94208 RepID=A0A2S4KS30_9HYPO|nr:hypothetical protein TPAR_06823 [Tolypocladium paradoxum]
MDAVNDGQVLHLGRFTDSKPPASRQRRVRVPREHRGPVEGADPAPSRRVRAPRAMPVELGRTAFAWCASSALECILAAAPTSTPQPGAVLRS